MNKKIIVTTVAALFAAIVLCAQPRAVGMRIGATGFDISYQHTLGSINFVQADLSTDFGYVGSGAAGFKATALYNFVFARPAWTQKGTWALYAGPGLSLGYVQDRAIYKVENYWVRPLDYGFMLSVTGQVGIEYTFWFPLQLSFDIRPYFGIHINDGVKYRSGNDLYVKYRGKVGFYDNGMMGFVPTLSVRYRF